MWGPLSHRQARGQVETEEEEVESATQWRRSSTAVQSIALDKDIDAHPTHTHQIQCQRESRDKIPIHGLTPCVDHSASTLRSRLFRPILQDAPT